MQKENDFELLKGDIGSEGKRISFKYFRPKDMDGRKFPFVIMLHGLMSNKDADTYERLSRSLLSKGIPSIRFDFPGRGESDGDIERITVEKDYVALKAIMDFSKDLSFVDTSRLGIIGSSMGGTISMLALSRSDDFKAGVIFCPVVDWKEKFSDGYLGRSLSEWKEKGYVEREAIKNGLPNMKLRYEFCESVMGFNGYEISESIKIPLCIVHGDNDRAVSYKQSEKLVSILPEGSELTIMKGADHYFKDEKHRVKRNDIALRWFLDHL